MTEHRKKTYFPHYCSKIEFYWFLRVNLACGRYSTITTVAQTLVICSCWLFFLIMEDERYFLLYAMLQLPAIITWVHKQTLHFLQKFQTIKPYKFWTINKSENPGSDLPALKTFTSKNEACCVIEIHLAVCIQKKASEPLHFQLGLTASFFSNRPWEMHWL